MPFTASRESQRSRKQRKGKCLTVLGRRVLVSYNERKTGLKIFKKQEELKLPPLPPCRQQDNLGLPKRVERGVARSEPNGGDMCGLQGGLGVTARQ